MDYSTHFSTKSTPQSEPIPGSKQVANSAGGFSFKVDDWTRLDRFLILGTEGGSYYASERDLTKDSGECIRRCIAADGVRAVRTIVEVSAAGRAPKNDPAIFALAMASKMGDVVTKRAARESLPAVARIGTDLFHFARYVEAFGGWGRGTRRAVAKWYEGKLLDKLAFQVAKYQSRDGWSHRDLLRLAHPKTETDAHAYLHAWAGRWEKPFAPIAEGLEKIVDGSAVPDGLQIVAAMEAAKRAASAKEIAKLVEAHGLTHEMIPTEWLKDPSVWAALLPKMGLWAMVRNLGRMTANGLLAPMSEAAGVIAGKLGDAEEIKRSRLHPVKILTALLQYKAGHGQKGSLAWSPVASVVDVLDRAFYFAFGSVEPARKRTLLALDVSGSMDGGAIAGVEGLTPRVGSAAMALVTAATEPQHAFVAFTSGSGRSWRESGLMEMSISPRQRLDDVCAQMSALPMGGTDCALPMTWATERKIPIDTFCVYTDSETWAGSVHPVQALKAYRDKMGIPARLVVVGMVANEFTIADPEDAGMLDVVGFDTATPDLISGFSAGRF